MAVRSPTCLIAFAMIVMICVCTTGISAAAKKKRKTSSAPLSSVDEQQGLCTFLSRTRQSHVPTTGPQEYCVWDMDLVSESTSPTRIVEVRKQRVEVEHDHPHSTMPPTTKTPHTRPLPAPHLPTSRHGTGEATISPPNSVASWTMWRPCGLWCVV